MPAAALCGGLVGDIGSRGRVKDGPGPRRRVHVKYCCGLCHDYFKYGFGDVLNEYVNGPTFRVAAGWLRPLTGSGIDYFSELGHQREQVATSAGIWATVLIRSFL